MFVKYVPGDTFFHKMDPRVKAFLVTMVVIFGMIFSYPPYLLVILTFLLIIWKFAGLSFKRVWKMISQILIFLPLILLATAFVEVESQRAIASRVLFGFHGIKLTVGGVLLGTTYLIRIFLFIFAMSLLTLTTELGSILKILEQLKFPYQLSFAMTVGLRFVPTLNKEKEDIIDAQKSRGVELEKGSLIKRLRSRIPIMVPLIVSGIIKSENLAKSVLSRGFGAKKTRTSLTELKMRKIDYLYLITFFILFLFGLYIRVLGYGVL